MYKSSFIRYFMTHKRFSNRSTESTLNGINTVVNVLFIFILGNEQAHRLKGIESNDCLHPKQGKPIQV